MHLLYREIFRNRKLKLQQFSCIFEEFFYLIFNLKNNFVGFMNFCIFIFEIFNWVVHLENVTFFV